MQKTATTITKRLFNQSSHYFIGTGLISLSHLISFPIYTRIFSINDYGILGLVTVSLSTVLAVSKFGLNTSAIRFYEDCKSNQNNYDLQQYYSTFFLGTVAFSGAISLLYFLIVSHILKDTFNKDISNLLSFTSVIIFLRTTVMILKTFLRAEQKTKIYNTIEILFNYLSILFSVFFVFFFIRGLYGFYSGKIIILFITLIFLVCRLYRKHKIEIKCISTAILSQSLKYGLPLMALEFFNQILSYADRYLILYFHGTERLAIYSVGYNLSHYLTNLFFVPLSLAITPILMEIWSKKGEIKTKEFLNTVTRYFALIIFPAIFALIAISDRLIPLLASSRYVESYKVVPFVVSGIALFSFSYIFNAGLIIFKRTNNILLFAGIASVLNIAFNLLLIPKYDILGAAYATLISYLIFFVLVVFSSFSYLSFKIPYKMLSLYFFSSVFMFIAVNLINTNNNLFSLIAKVGVGTITYSGLLLAFDREISKKCNAIIR